MDSARSTIAASISVCPRQRVKVPAPSHEQRSSVMTQRVNVPRLPPIAAVLLATGTMMGTANAATIDAFNLDNIEADDSGAGGITAEVYQDPGTNADTNGF